MHSTMAASPDFIPGTVHLVDLEGTIHARHAAGGKSDIVLVPAPSDHPDDPLNWSPRRKLLSLTCLCMYVNPGLRPQSCISLLTMFLPRSAIFSPSELRQLPFIPS
jgi:hypothetical protein